MGVVFWTGGGWTVDEYGLGSIHTDYYIPASRLGRLIQGDQPAAAWPVEMASKEDVEFDCFMEAFRHALAFHKGKYQPFPAGAYDEALRLVLVAELAKESK